LISEINFLFIILLMKNLSSFLFRKSLNFKLFKARYFSTNEGLIDHTPENTLMKCKLINKKYITHDTFIGQYTSIENKLINVPTGMHVNVM
jgi:hypothetical protein